MKSFILDSNIEKIIRNTEKRRNKGKAERESEIDIDKEQKLIAKAIQVVASKYIFLTKI